MNNQAEQHYIPLGSGKEIVSEREQLQLPAEEVANTVTWVNPAFPEAPFRLKEGEPTKLGVFFTPSAHEDASKRHVALLPEFVRTRSGILGSVIFKDDAGRMYRDVDVKGMGFVENSRGEMRVVPAERRRDADLGIADSPFIERDRIFSEKFLAAGIRTYRLIGIVKLQEIIDGNGKHISIEEAKDRGMVGPDTRPVAVIRAFGTKERLSTLKDAKSGRKQAAMNDARLLVAQELGADPEVFSHADYLEWFSRTLGEQVAALRNHEFHHGYLTGHNITLDCRIVDLDSVDTVQNEITDGKWKNRPEREIYDDDYLEAKKTIEQFVYDYTAAVPDDDRMKASWSLRQDFVLDHYVDLFDAAYHEHLQKNGRSETSKKQMH